MTVLLLVIDLAFFVANAVKIADGGWVPVTLTVVIFAVMTTWHRGRQRLGQRLRESMLPLDAFLADLAARPPIRVPGLAVFLSGNATSTPGALLHNLKHNKVLHERVLLVTVRTEPVARVAEADRLRLTGRGHGFFSLTVHFGFKEDQNLPRVLGALDDPAVGFKPMETSYFLGRETVLPGQSPGMAAWRRRLFIWMSRNALNAAAFFSLPPNRVVELGMHVEI
jgi:KUP system potassium uptake protein